MTTSTRNALQWESNDNDYQEIEVVSVQKLPPETEWIDTKEAADIMNVALSTVSALCRRGKIECRQHGEGRRSVWEVDKASAMTYVKSVGGRPKKKKK